MREDSSGAYWACGDCGASLGPLDANYKDACLQDVRPVSESNPLIGDPSLFVDDAVEFRLFCCPGCGAQIENEIAVATDPILRDIRVDLAPDG